MLCICVCVYGGFDNFHKSEAQRFLLQGSNVRAYPRATITIAKRVKLLVRFNRAHSIITS